jgi:ATP-dependent exoDNAse (exonuclease V) beta subunit
MSQLDLSVKNAHPRDKDLQFDEPTHVYTINGSSDYKSVTTWLHTFFPHFDVDSVIKKMRKSKKWTPDNKYYHLTNAEIKNLWETNGKESADLGTAMHLNLEYYYNGLPFTEGFEGSKEYLLFKEYLDDHKDYKPYRTEWAVYSKKYKLAGSIDLIYTDPKDPTKIIIADYKRCKEIKYSNIWQKGYPPLDDIDDCNYWHYTLQLNIYRMILEKYYGQTVSEMFLIVLHPNQDHYLKIPIKKISKPIIKMLNCRLNEL